MMGSNWAVEDYSAWRRERVAEAADLARSLTYQDLSGWQRIQDIYTEVRRARGDDGQPGRPKRRGWWGHALRLMRAQLVHLVS